jgi:hypothetical protein
VGPGNDLLPILNAKPAALACHLSWSSIVWHPRIIIPNGASQLILDMFGPEEGDHAQVTIRCLW